MSIVLEIYFSDDINVLYDSYTKLICAILSLKSILSMQSKRDGRSNLKCACWYVPVNKYIHCLLPDYITFIEKLFQLLSFMIFFNIFLLKLYQAVFSNSYSFKIDQKKTNKICTIISTCWVLELDKYVIHN